jgi:serine/threonine protein kinase
MTPERWEQVEQLFEAALEIEPSGRAAFLDRACQDYPELRSEVEQLLAADEITTGVLDEPLPHMEASSVAPGTRLGSYEILAAIGAGGMGEVYRARDTRLRRTVAIKVLPRRLSNDPKVRARFEREARAVAGLNHPHICTLYDVAFHDQIPFLVMEYLEGENLAARIRRGPLPLEESVRYCTQIAQALKEAHKLGILHRDLKPSNIMLTARGAKLLDFGLAKFHTPGTRAKTSFPSRASGRMPVKSKPAPFKVAIIEKLTHALRARLSVSHNTELNETQTQTDEGVILGTLHYMAPEQLQGLPVDPRTDIFAFGLILYEMVTGGRPYVGCSRAALIAEILDGKTPSISRFLNERAKSLDGVMQRCLATESGDRWASGGELANALNDILAGARGRILRAAVEQVRGSPSLSRHPLVIRFHFSPSIFRKFKIRPLLFTLFIIASFVIQQSYSLYLVLEVGMLTWLCALAILVHWLWTRFSLSYHRTETTREGYRSLNLSIDALIVAVAVYLLYISFPLYHFILWR